MRRRRTEVSIELRKNKREDTLQKRRNIYQSETSDDDLLSVPNLKKLVSLRRMNYNVNKWKNEKFLTHLWMSHIHLYV
jgi:hypothetical protein